MDGGIGFGCWSNCSPDNDGSGNGKRNQGSTTWREGDPWCYLKKPNGDGVNCNFKSGCDDSTFECMNKEDSSKLGGCG